MTGHQKTKYYRLKQFSLILVALLLWSSFVAQLFIPEAVKAATQNAERECKKAITDSFGVTTRNQRLQACYFGFDQAGPLDGSPGSIITTNGYARCDQVYTGGIPLNTDCKKGVDLYHDQSSISPPPQLSRLRIKTIERDGTPLRGIKITISPSCQAKTEVTTNDKGEASFNCPKGRGHTLNFGGKEGYRIITRETVANAEPRTAAYAARYEKIDQNRNNEEDNCDNQATTPLSWIICPLVDLGQGISQTIFGEVLEPLLKDIPVSTNRDNGAYNAWQGFRFLANIILVGSMLVLVYGVARGGGQ